MYYGLYCDNRSSFLPPRYVLEQILSGEATETVVENIHDYLTTIGTDVRAGKIKLDEFIIYKVELPYSLSCSLLTLIVNSV